MYGEPEFLVRQRAHAASSEFADWLGIDQAIVELLGPGEGVCLEVGCGTGIYAERIRGLGWTPVGVDLSAGMLAHARGRLPVAQGDAMRLPFADGVVPAVAVIMVHTDLPAYRPVLAEALRVLRPGGVPVHVGVHPCFCGWFADRSDLERILIPPGYLEVGWATASYTDHGVRDKIGASHLPLAALLNEVMAAGFVLAEFREGGPVTPMTMSFRAHRN